MYSPENRPSEVKIRQRDRAVDLLTGAGFGVIATGIAFPYDRDMFPISPPDIIQGHIFDTFAPLVHGYLHRAIIRRDLKYNTSVSFIAPSSQEIAQSAGIMPGTFDPVDFAAFGLGSAIFYAIEKFRSRKISKELSSSQNSFVQ